MKKILVNLYVPLIEESYEIFIPNNKTIGGAIELICKVLNDWNEEHFKLISYNLYNQETGEIYNKESTIKDSNIVNGTKLILV